MSLNIISTIGALLFAGGLVAMLAIAHYVLYAMVSSRDYGFAVLFGVCLMIIDGYLLTLVGAS